jgi:hypothetical protein
MNEGGGFVRMFFGFITDLLEAFIDAFVGIITGGTD